VRNLLALLAVAALAFAGVGWYLDWYKIKTEPAQGGHHHVNIDFNGPKIKEDSQRGVQKVEERVQKILDKKLSAEKGDADKAGSGNNSSPSTAPRLRVDQENEQSTTTGPDLP
jgi:hypothetical protein